jgi:hypothetical protein
VLAQAVMPHGIVGLAKWSLRPRLERDVSGASAMPKPLAECHVAQSVLRTGEREQLEALVRSRSLPAGLVRRAKIVLHAADGEANSAIAK